MGTYYSIYAEVHVGDKWYNISPLARRENGDVRAQPIIYGQSLLRDAYEELEEDCYMRGRPADISDELKQIFNHEDDEICDYFLRDMTYKQYYSQTLFVVNYGKHVKSRVKENKPTRYQGYVEKHCLAAYELGEVEDIHNWIHPTEYEKLSPRAKKEYVYYEWDEWGDWYAVYVDLVKKVDCLLDFFKDWGFYNIKCDNLDERYPSADYVRLIVERD